MPWKEASVLGQTLGTLIFNEPLSLCPFVQEQVSRCPYGQPDIHARILPMHRQVNTSLAAIEHGLTEAVYFIASHQPKHIQAVCKPLWQTKVEQGFALVRNLQGQEKVLLYLM